MMCHRLFCVSLVSMALLLSVSGCKKSPNVQTPNVQTPQQTTSAVSCTASESSMLVSPKGEEIIFPKCILVTHDSPYGPSYEHEPGCELSAEFINDIIIKDLDVNQYNEYGDTPLMLATDVDSVNKLIKAGADVNHTNFFGNSALDYAQNVEIVRAILQSGKCHIKKLNLHLLVDNMLYKPDIFRELITSGIIDLKSDKELGFQMLVETDSAEVAKILLDAGADVNYVDVYKENIWDKAWNKKPEYIKAIVNSGKCTIHAPHDLDLTHFPSYDQQASVIELYNHVFDDETKNSFAKAAVVHVSRECNRVGETDLNLEKLLAENGIKALFDQKKACEDKLEAARKASMDSNEPSNHIQERPEGQYDNPCDDPNAPFYNATCALEEENKKIRQRARAENPYKDKTWGEHEFEFDYNDTWSDGDDARGMRYRDDRVLRTWLARGGNVNAKDNEGRTPLFYVKYAKEARILLAAGADINATDTNGNTPLLHFEQEYTKNMYTDDDVAYDEIISALLNAGADKNVVNKEGKSMQDYENERKK